MNPILQRKTFFMAVIEFNFFFLFEVSKYYFFGSPALLASADVPARAGGRRLLWQPSSHLRVHIFRNFIHENAFKLLKMYVLRTLFMI